MSSKDVCLMAGNNLLSFGQGIHPDLQTDIMNGLLYAQLLADQRYERHKTWESWIERYKTVIQESGSQLTGQISPSPLKIKNIKEARALSLNAAGSASSSHLQQLWVRSFDTLVESDHAQVFFDSWFSSGRSESFQVVPCESDGKGGATVLLCGLQMTTTALDTSFSFWDLFLPWFLRTKKLLSGEMTVRSNGAAFRFTAQGYEPHRQAIQEYLRSQARQEIIEL